MSPYRHSLSRRTFLRGAGGASLGLPFLEAMLAAQPTPPPRRVIFMYTGNGQPMKSWRPTAGADSSTFTLSPLLKPLETIKNDCVFIEGLPMLSSLDPEQQSQGHPAGATAVLTGAWAGPGNMYAGGCGKSAGPPATESVDQAIARAIGRNTKFPALHQGVVRSENSIARRPFYTSTGQIVAPNFDVNATYNQLFKDLDPAPSGPALKAVRMQARRSVLNAVMDDMRALRCKLGAPDRKRLEEHLTALEDTERRLGIVVPAGSGCKKPPAPGSLSADVFANMPQLGKLQMDMLAQAIACDLTRVGGLVFYGSDANPKGIYSWLGPLHTSSHHDFSHLQGQDPQPRLVEIGTFFAEQLAYLVGRLKALPEGTGTVFDNTAIVWCTEIGDPWTHDRRNVPFVIAGSGGGLFKTGQYLRYPGTTGFSHNRLLHTLARSFGVMADGFGPVRYQQGGPLTELSTGRGG